MLTTLLPVRLPAQDARALLVQSAAAYRRLASYADEGTREYAMGQQTATTRFKTWHRRGEGMRTEWTGPGLTEVVWTKGKERFEYRASNRQRPLTRWASLSKTTSESAGAIDTPSSLEGRWVAELLSDPARSLDLHEHDKPEEKWERMSASRLDGTLCDVLVCRQGKSTFKIWLDGSTHLVRRMERWPEEWTGPGPQTVVKIKPRPNAEVAAADLAFRPPKTEALPSLPLPPPLEPSGTLAAPAKPETELAVHRMILSGYSLPTTLTDEIEMIDPVSSTHPLRFTRSLALRRDQAMRYVDRDPRGDVRTAYWSNGLEARMWQIEVSWRTVTVVETATSPAEAARVDDRFLLASGSFAPPPHGFGGPPPQPGLREPLRNFRLTDAELDGRKAWLAAIAVTSGFMNQAGPHTSNTEVWFDPATGLPLRERFSSAGNGQRAVQMEVTHHVKADVPLRPEDLAFLPPSVDLWETLFRRRED